MSIKWHEINSVNVEAFDQDHKKLVGLINRLSLKTTKKNIDKIFKELKKYSIRHFKSEETYLKKFSYPQRAVHKQHHLAFLKKLGEFEKQYKNGNLNLIGLMEFLGKWWIYHINHDDFEYGDFLNSHGIF